MSGKSKRVLELLENFEKKQKIDGKNGKYYPYYKKKLLNYILNSDESQNSFVSVPTPTKGLETYKIYIVKNR